MTEEACRIDVWLWRARFFKTRGMAGRFIEAGRVRLTRQGAEARVDKPARPVKAGDDLVFAIGGRVFALRVLDLGARRGPAAEARLLYSTLEDSAPSC